VHIDREIVFPSSPAEVWEALTDPERLEEWFATEVELDARPGGVGVFRWGDGDERRAVVREIEAEERLVLDWEDDGQVVLELEEVEGGTRLHVVEVSPEWSTALELHALGEFGETAAGPPGRAGRRAAASSVAPIATAIGAPCVLASRRPSHPCDGAPFRQTLPAWVAVA
jgi:uncharacterized protein YndB with AHSA1/START domain